MRSEKSKEFQLPEKDNIISVKLSDVVLVLSHRAPHPVTKRLSGILKFNLTLSQYAMQSAFQTLILLCIKCFEWNYWQETHAG